MRQDITAAHAIFATNSFTVFFLTCAPLFSACEGDDKGSVTPPTTQGTDEYSAELFPSTTVLDDTGEQNFPSFLVDDDGGVVIASFSSVPQASKGSFWMMKGPAKGGSMIFTDGSTVTDAPVTKATCAMTRSDWNISPTKVSLGFTDRSVTESDVTPTVTHQKEL